MAFEYEKTAGRKRISVPINKDLVEKARSFSIDLSATFETALVHELAKAEAALWAEKNARAIAANNQFIEKNGCLGDFDCEEHI